MHTYKAFSCLEETSRQSERSTVVRSDGTNNYCCLQPDRAGCCELNLAKRGGALSKSTVKFYILNARFCGTV